MEGKNEEQVKTKKGKHADVIITLEEHFDQHKLNYILQNSDAFAEKMRDKCFEDDYNPFAIAKKYLAKSREGVVKVEYKQNAGFARFYAIGGLSLQGFPREIRHTIAKAIYTDIDMVNAHPVILLHLCQGRHILTPQLENYVKNRDTLLQGLPDRDHAKIAILSLMNGGDKDFRELKDKPEWLSLFGVEMTMIHANFAKDKEFKKHKKTRAASGKDYNHEASYMNTLLCDFENNILMTARKALGKQKHEVLCFDGIMTPIGEYDLAALANSVHTELGIKMAFAVKDMKDGFELPEDVGKYSDKCDPNMFDWNDQYTYQDFYNEHLEQHFDSIAHANEVLDEKYPLVMAKMLEGDVYVKKFGGCSYGLSKKLTISDFNIYIGKSKTKLKFSKFLEGKKAFGKFECKLDGANPKNFNLWTGFTAFRTAEKPESLETVKKFIFETWASSNQEYYNYIISWIAGLFNPKGRNEVCLTMVSEQGTGKGTLLDFLRGLIGRGGMADCIGISAITQAHNTTIAGKRLIVLNEIASSKEQFRADFDKLKSLITDPVIEINPKGKDQFSIDAISNIMCFTNHPDSIILEASDRRYAVFSVSDCHINDEKYFADLRAEILNQETYDAFYTYLLDFQAVSLREIVNTPIRQQMLGISRPSPFKFLDYKFEELSMAEENGEPAERKIQAMTLYQEYDRWCKMEGIRTVMSNTKFGLSLATAKIEKKRNKYGYYYNLEKPNAENQ